MANETLKMWRAKDGMTKPKLVECPDGLYPANDADGIAIFVNTHFETEDEAWRSIESSVLAHVALAGNFVNRAKQQLKEAQEEAAEAAGNFAEYQRNVKIRKPK